MVDLNFCGTAVSLTPSIQSIQRSDRSMRNHQAVHNIVNTNILLDKNGKIIEKINALNKIS